MTAVRLRRGVVVGGVAMACTLLLGGSSCQAPPPAEGACGYGAGEPWSMLAADGDHVVFSSSRTDLGPDANGGSCDLFVRMLSTGVVERATSEAAIPSAIAAVSRDATLLLYSVTGETRLLDRTTGTVVWSVPGTTDHVDVDASGRYVVWNHGTLVTRLDRTDDSVAQLDVADLDGVSDVSVSDDGARVAVGGVAGGVVWHPASGQTDTFATVGVFGAAISPDGSTVAWAGPAIPPLVGNDTRLWQAGLGEIASLGGSAYLKRPMTWSIDSAWVLFTGSSASVPSNANAGDIGTEFLYAHRVRDGLEVRLVKPGTPVPLGSQPSVAFTPRMTNGTSFLGPVRDGAVRVLALAP